MRISISIKILLLFLIFTVSATNTDVKAQTKGLDIVSTAGGNAMGTGLMQGVNVSWTIGDIVIDESRNSRKWLSQGFQQGILDTIRAQGDIDTMPPADIEALGEEMFIVSVYPNPIQNEFHYYIHSLENFVFGASLFDAKGRVVFNEKDRKGNSEYTHYLSNLTSGIYFLRIYLPQYRIQQTYKIIKQ